MSLQLQPGIYRLNDRRLGYFRMSDTFARDGELSMRARSVGLYALSHREGFVLQQARAAQHLQMSENTFRGALGDLAQRGYVRFGAVREGQRVVGTWYVIHDEPLPEETWIAALADLQGSLTADSEVTDSEGSGSEVHKGYQFNAGLPSTSTPSVSADAPPRATPQPPLDIPPPAPVQAGVQTQERQDGKITRRQLAEDSWLEFWSAYDHKIAKLTARKAWDTVIVKLKADPQEVINAAKRYRGTFGNGPGDRKFMAHAATWLNAGRWEDAMPGQPGQAPSAAHAQARLQELAQEGNAEAAAREAGVPWCGWQVQLTPEERRTPEGRREAFARWGRAWIEDHEAELVTGMTGRSG